MTITGEEPPLSARENSKRELKLYREMKQSSMKENPLLWWKMNAFMFPRLSKLATRYGCVQATSVASERVFSTTGYIVCATRACLKTESVNALVFLKKNMQF
jgi:hypothetical protein